ncbi:tetratricopeptide repeat protein [Sansalvadorimonas verongulae]|uniref:tetratricopeptide repeat protein n=1 Tax=Sansalvadorimonas verongulae TaxID=2172824 RepID=UPI0012BB72CC|nr:tetratricopeptide repeat protein [Sansalvadorimonas verongulae]MTI13977.1 tetratricopeptide repeat protein [Sansalvadorimonas verongulae]
MTHTKTPPPAADHSLNAEQLFYQGIEELNQEKLPEAKESLEASFKLNPANSGTPFNLAICYIRMGMYEPALEMFEKTIELEPDLTIAYFNAGKAASLMENFEEAVHYFDRSLKGNLPETQVLTARGIALHGCGRMKDALADFNKVLEQEENLICLQFRANSLLAMHEFQRSLTDTDKLLELGQNTADTLSIKFLCLKHLERYQEALETFDQLQIIDPKAGQQLNETLAKDLEEARSAVNLIARSSQ